MILTALERSKRFIVPHLKHIIFVFMGFLLVLR